MAQFGLILGVGAVVMGALLIILAIMYVSSSPIPIKRSVPPPLTPDSTNTPPTPDSTSPPLTPDSTSIPPTPDTSIQKITDKLNGKMYTTPEGVLYFSDGSAKRMKEMTPVYSYYFENDTMYLTGVGVYGRYTLNSDFSLTPLSPSSPILTLIQQDSTQNIDITNKWYESSLFGMMQFLPNGLALTPSMSIPYSVSGNRLTIRNGSLNMNYIILSDFTAFPETSIGYTLTYKPSYVPPVPPVTNLTGVKFFNGISGITLEFINTTTVKKTNLLNVIETMNYVMNGYKITSNGVEYTLSTDFSTLRDSFGNIYTKIIPGAPTPNIVNKCFVNARSRLTFNANGTMINSVEPDIQYRYEMRGNAIIVTAPNDAKYSFLYENERLLRDGLVYVPCPPLIDTPSVQGTYPFSGKCFYSVIRNRKSFQFDLIGNNGTFNNLPVKISYDPITRIIRVNESGIIYEFTYESSPLEKILTVSGQVHSTVGSC